MGRVFRLRRAQGTPVVEAGFGVCGSLNQSAGSSRGAIRVLKDGPTERQILKAAEPMQARDTERGQIVDYPLSGKQVDALGCSRVVGDQGDGFDSGRCFPDDLEHGLGGCAVKALVGSQFSTGKCPVNELGGRASTLCGARPDPGGSERLAGQPALHDRSIPPAAAVEGPVEITQPGVGPGRLGMANQPETHSCRPATRWRRIPAEPGPGLRRRRRGR